MKHRTLSCLTILGVLTGLGFVAAQPAAQPSPETEYIYPAIATYGKVVKLKDAAQQPQDGSRIVVDVTGGGKPDQLNSSIEKVCRFVNIYAGAGQESAKVDIAVVVHGAATLSILNSDAYDKRFKVKENPTLKVLEALRKANVRLFVCGQSLIGTGAGQSHVDFILRLDDCM